MKNVKEDLIHYIWKTKSFDLKGLKTTDNQILHVTSFGIHNHDAGPDFLDARIEINGVVWAGHIEIHLKASDWLRHQHQHDPKYQNVILHVVLEADMPIKLADNTTIPCLELKSRINQALIARYQYLQHNKAWVPCASLIHSMSDLTKQITMDRHLTQRLIAKTEELQVQFAELNNDWTALIYQRLAWAFGLKVNAEAMLNLAKSIPYSFIQKHRDQLIQVEALLFGQSGLLPRDISEPYVDHLIREYSMMQAKFGLKPVSPVIWKFSRLRPAGFPTIRIAQLAKFLHQGIKLDELIFNADIESINRVFNISLSGYWTDHYRFGSISKKRNKTLGTGTKSILVINVMVPILFMYGIIRRSELHKERAILLLEQFPPEHNRITDRWITLGMRNKTSADSQALIQLKKMSCDKHKCMSCPIGHKIVTNDT